MRNRSLHQKFSVTHQSQYQLGILKHTKYKIYSLFCVPAKVTKLVGLKNKGGLSPINLVTFAVTQNGE